MSDDLLARVRRLRKATEAETATRRRDVRYSRTERAREDVANAGRFAYQVTEGLRWVWRTIASPTLSWLLWKIGIVLRLYRRLWSYAVHRRTPDGALLFSRSRAGAMLLATFVTVWYLLVPIAEAALDTAFYLATVRREHLYLFGSQEIDPVTAMHNIEGSDHMPWTPEDSIYLRAEGGLFANLWSLTHKGTLYWPENVGAAVPYGYSWCYTTYYGVRLRLWGIRNSFMRILDVSCEPLKERGAS